MMQNIEEAITIHYTKMFKTDKKIFEQIMADPAQYVGLSIHDMADRFDVSSPTILRAIKKIGYSGYPEFKLALESFVTDKNQEKPVIKNSLFHEVINTYERSFSKLKELDWEKDIIEVVEWMLDSQDVKCVGFDNTGLAAQQLVYSLYSQGVFYEAITTETQMHYLSQTAKKDWVYIIYSVTGMELYSGLVKAANEVGAKTVLITMNKDAEIAKNVSKTFFLPAASTFLRDDGSLRQLDVRLELFLFSEIISYYFNWVGDQREQVAKS
ncbi:MurR/RpiR family transcriptional regulator [Enterococcus sp. DIV0756]|uniref:MurR/RpiR family transcriptional regulator n=1 Tax=Enterococcus sp. DIV0756 TaxID=2774636 RepID=UPI003F206837